MENRPRVVVGVDGSPDSKAVLRFALEDAARRGARVEVVRAFRPPDGSGVDFGTSAVPTIEQATADIEGGTRELVEGVIGERDGALSGVPFDVEAVPGHAGSVLVGAARGAEMLVVGHRGRGGLAATLLGSVGLHCILHAPCTVTVVRSAAIRETSAEPVGLAARQIGSLPA